MVDCYPEEEKNGRKQLVANHQELSQLTQEVLGMRSETNSFSQATDHTGQLMKEIDMQIQDIFRILAERGQLTIHIGKRSNFKIFLLF